MARLLGLSLAALLLAGCVGGGDDGAVSIGLARGAVVAAAHPLAAEAGAEMLRAGGNAVDAAAAVQWALNVVEPEMSGLGGGAFLLLWLADEQRAVVLDGREVAPGAATADMFMNRPAGEDPDRMGYAVGVPGTLAAFAKALRDHGTMSLVDTMGPAIRLAEEGFTVDEHLAAYAAENLDELRSWPPSAAVFVNGATCPPVLPAPVGGVAGCVGGTALAEGDRLVQPDLASTFRTLSRYGTGAFYDGPLAEAIVATAAQRGGRMTTSDLASYQVAVREPLRASYGNVEVVTMPPPGGGLTVLQTLLLLEGLDVASLGHNTADSLHVLIEAMHLAFADRAAYVGDPSFVDVPVAGLLDPSYLDTRRALIDMNRANDHVQAGAPPGSRPGGRTVAERDGDGHTTHFVVVDARGNIASVTTTLESAFGTGLMVPGYGFLLNDELTDFDATPGGVNEVEPGKRPRSSMSPTLVLRDGEPILALGSPGSRAIIGSVAQVTMNVIDHGMPLRSAVEAGRLYSPEFPYVYWDRELDIDTVAALEARNHTMVHNSGARIGNVQAAMLVDGGWVGVADTRGAPGGVVSLPAGAH